VSERKNLLGRVASLHGGGFRRKHGGNKFQTVKMTTSNSLKALRFSYSSKSVRHVKAMVNKLGGNNRCRVLWGKYNRGPKVNGNRTEARTGEEAKVETNHALTNIKKEHSH